MSSRNITLILAALLPACAIPAQEPTAPSTDHPPKAKIFKREVDGLIGALRSASADDGALGDGSCRQTAMVLAAAGHSHRFYHAGDGPWLRRALDSLFVHRRTDGAFADGDGDDVVTTTRWVLAALHVLDPESYATEIETGRAFLAASGAAATDIFAEHVAATRNGAAQSAELIELMRSSATLPAPGAPPDLAAAPDSLLDLVCRQVVARGGDLKPAPVEAAATWSPAQERGFAFLMTQQEGGVFGVTFGGHRIPDVGLTGIGLAALQTKPVGLRSEEERSAIEAGLTWLRAAQNDDGSFGEQNVNYNTCAVVMAIAQDDHPANEEILGKAQRYILAIQNVEGRGFAPSDRDFGSIGYGGDQRGDLSNLQFAVEALRITELDENHEAFAKAIRFLERTQNLRSHNDFEARVRSTEDGSWQDVAPGDDGGSAYYPGNSPAGYYELPDGTKVPRSYGSMTYALLKTYTLCGVPPDDPRVLAAVAWIQEHWTLETNPGVDPALGPKAAYQGLYYYFMVMAQALDTTGLDQLTSGERTIDWRQVLAEHLATLQRDDGSWLNADNGRWWEDQPLVCTVYAMLALDRCAQRPE